MSCPTCSHTLQTVFMDAHRSISHCPRCGTMRSVLMGHTDDVAPKLVERCRGLIETVKGDAGVHAGAAELLCVLHRLGVTEAVHKPEDRPA